jgi:(p)ppGpp synthase/HD superfamily hydrolase
MEETLETAICFATHAHMYQRDKGKKAYILHPLRVMMAVAPDREAMIAAVLHDVIEDCGFTRQDLWKECTSSKEILDAIMLVSRESVMAPERRTYLQFITDIKESGNQIAIKVKLADLADNMSPDRVEQLAPEEKGLIARYEMAKAILEE